jgi:hypothetical protein
MRPKRPAFGIGFLLFLAIVIWAVLRTGIIRF